MRRLPGDPSPEEQKARMIRVNHAGEEGALRIYDGQLAALKGTKVEPLIQQMRDQEEGHAHLFRHLLKERNVRPTVLNPLWWGAGYLLGYITGKLGASSAMACTVAVEEVIEKHYERQQKDLLDPALRDPELSEAIQTCHHDEREHKETALLHEAEKAPGYFFLRKAIKGATRLAISLSKRI